MWEDFLCHPDVLRLLDKRDSLYFVVSEFASVVCEKFLKFFVMKNIKVKERGEILGIINTDPGKAWGLAVSNAENLTIFADLLTYTSLEYVKKLRLFVDI